MAQVTKPCAICGSPITRPKSKFWTETPTCSKRCQFAKQRQTFGENHPAWRGGKGTINAMGYLVVRKQGRTVLVHRLVMEAHIGRPLEAGEVVHHINGDRSDNRIQNLVLCKTQAEHNRHHSGDGKRSHCVHCDNPEWAKGLCKTHYSRMRRGIPADRPVHKRHRS